jgi:O-antigen biosynthesis protein
MFDNNLSIILLTYNFLENTKKCVFNLYAHTSVCFELVIVDNNSTDGTVDFINTLKEKKDGIVFHQNKENVGIIRGRNQGYFLCDDSNNFICFLDDDQVVQKNWLDSYEELFKKGYHLVSSEAWKMRQGDFFPTSKVTEKTASFNYVGAGSSIIKKKVIKDIGLKDIGIYDERFIMAYWEDPDLIFRAHDAGYKIGWNYHKAVIHEHQGPLLPTERKKHFYDNWEKFQKKWNGREIPTFKMEYFK